MGVGVGGLADYNGGIVGTVREQKQQEEKQQEKQQEKQKQNQLEDIVPIVDYGGRQTYSNIQYDPEALSDFENEAEADVEPHPSIRPQWRSTRGGEVDETINAVKKAV